MKASIIAKNIKLLHRSFFLFFPIWNYFFPKPKIVKLIKCSNIFPTEATETKRRINFKKILGTTLLI
jgi:hypothetical protein